MGSNSVSALLTALLLNAARATGPRCKSQTNTNVDWWVIYKFPVLTNAQDGTPWRNGYGYAYMDSQNPGAGMTPAAPVNISSLQDEKMALTYTLAQVRSTHPRVISRVTQVTVSTPPELASLCTRDLL
jgi:hypothetical protein